MYWWVMNWAEKLGAGKVYMLSLVLHWQTWTTLIWGQWKSIVKGEVMDAWADGWIERMEEEARRWAEKLISDSLWVSHYYGYCVVWFRICKALTVHSPAAGSTFLVKVRLGLNYSLSVSRLSTSTCSPWERKRGREWQAGKKRKKNKSDKTIKEYSLCLENTC